MPLFQDLINSKEDGENKFSACDQSATTTLTNTGLVGKQTIQRELESLRIDWEQYSVELGETQTRLQAIVTRWEEYEHSYEALADWMKTEEKRVKDYTLVASLEDKKSQVIKYQVNYAITHCSLVTCVFCIFLSTVDFFWFPI